MLSYIWLTMILLSLITGVINGTLDLVFQQIFISGQKGIELAFSLTIMMTLWLGIMRIAEDAGLIELIGNKAKPLLRYLFPSIPEKHPALGAIAFNISANMLGIGNAATPFGIKAMEELQSLNSDKNAASDDMCMLLAINTSSVQLIPATVIMLLSIAGSQEPTAIILSTLMATTINTIVAVTTAFKLAKHTL